MTHGYMKLYTYKKHSASTAVVWNLIHEQFLLGKKETCKHKAKGMTSLRWWLLYTQLSHHRVTGRAEVGKWLLWFYLRRSLAVVLIELCLWVLWFCFYFVRDLSVFHNELYFRVEPFLPFRLLVEFAGEPCLDRLPAVQQNQWWR